jgi:hypothetical protein
MVTGFAEAMRQREPGESVLARARRFYTESLTRGDPTLGHRGVGFARMVDASPALLARERQIHDQREVVLAAALAQDLNAAADDITPRIVTAQVTGALRVLYYEARRRLLAGQSGTELDDALAQTAQSAFDLLQTDLGDYGG